MAGSSRNAAVERRGVVRKPLITLAAVCALALPAIGIAGNAGDGSDYGTQPGFTVANDNTPCAGHGSRRSSGGAAPT